jgi:oxygen-independent coproporphyrinogen-3 oxidase
MSEYMMTGLRLTKEGVSDKEFPRRFGTSMQDVFGEEIDELLKLELIERHESPSPNGRGMSAGQGEGLRLTQRGRLLGNQVFMRFV